MSPYFELIRDKICNNNYCTLFGQQNNSIYKYYEQGNELWKQQRLKITFAAVTLWMKPRHMMHDTGTCYDIIICSPK